MIGEPLTRKTFIAAYCERSGMTQYQTPYGYDCEGYRAHAVPCGPDCDEEQCDGWQMRLLEAGEQPDLTEEQDPTVEQLQAQIASLTAENERLRSAIQNWLAAIDEYRAFLKKGLDVNSAVGIQYAIALDFREADLRAALQPKEGEG